MKKNIPLISVIVPIYNVEKYLDRCIESIVNQTYKNLEIILIDDGSPDGCPKICDSWAKKDKRIKVIHKENGGLSSARNVGIEFSSGDYIAFVDSDDLINKKMYEKLSKNLFDTKSDISICAVLDFYYYDEINKYENNLIISRPKIETFSNLDKFSNLYNKKVGDTTIACNKLYKKDIFKKLRYPKGKINEDTFLAPLILNEAKKIVYTEEKLYYYLQRENSIMHTKFNIKKLDELEAFKSQMIFFNQSKFKNTIYTQLSKLRYIDKILVLYCKLKNNNINNNYNDKIKELYEEFKCYYKEIINIKLPLKKRIKYYAFRYIPNIFYIINRNRFY